MQKIISTVCLLLLCACLAQAQQPFRIISYNILEGMKTDTTPGKQQFVAWVKEKDPDILALQECNGFTQQSLEALARSYGHPYAVIVKEKGYPTGLTSKYPITAIRRINENMTHGYITAKVKGYQILVLHLNPHQYKKRREEIAAILSDSAMKADKNSWVIMGDFNSHSPQDRSRMQNGRVIKVQQAAKQRNPKIENLVDGQHIDFTVQQAMLDAGFTDAAFYYDESRIDTDSRIDYIYLSKNLRKKLLYCAFITEPFTKKFSDHRPVMLELKAKRR
ncbi:endonuclease/exonuclease/phosphatase family protein [Chitinophaga lutea]